MQIYKNQTYQFNLGSVYNIMIKLKINYKCRTN